MLCALVLNVTIRLELPKYPKNYIVLVFHYSFDAELKVGRNLPLTSKYSTFIIIETLLNPKLFQLDIFELELKSICVTMNWSIGDVQCLF